MSATVSPIMSASHASPNAVSWSDEELSLSINFDDALFPQFDDHSWTTDTQSPMSTTQIGSVTLQQWHSPSAYAKVQSNALSVTSQHVPVQTRQDVQPLEESPEADSSSSSDDGQDSKGHFSLQERATKKNDSNGKAKVQRRQGVTCDQCRSKHIRCVMQQSTLSSSPEAPSTPASVSAKSSPAGRCTRCVEKGLACTRNHAPPSRRYPRPSRTGKRIEQARLLHGTIAGGESTKGILDGGAGGTVLLDPQHSSASGPTAALAAAIIAASNSIPHTANLQLHQHVIAGSVSLRLLTCFFATAHMQLPIVDFHNFSARYNFSQGDFRIMSIMANGGDDVQRVPSARQSAPGLWANHWPPTVASGSSTRSTPGTTEALVAAMHAWAALYTDMPIAFGSNAGLLSLARQEDERTIDNTQKPTFFDARPSVIKDVDESGNRVSSEEQPALVMSANGKLRRPKRKQGVACDTCRLRRLRCDKLERPEGMGCSRCEDKRIICTDEYIQSKRTKGSGTSTDAAPTTKTTTPEVPAVVIGKTPTDQDAEHDVISSARYAHAQDLTSVRGTGPASWQGFSSQQAAWIDAGPTLPQNYKFGRGREMLAYGKARQAFSHTMLERAMSLVGRHELLQTPSLESIQTLMILVQILNLLRRTDTANELAEAVNSHLTLLGLESTDEVDEQDKSAVEQILSNMQRKRLWCCVWTRDALINGLYRKVPAFEAERAFGIKGNTGARRDRQVVIVSANGQNGGSKGSSGNAAHYEASSTSQTDAASLRSQEMNGEMGLSFSIMALMQVGALSRFMGKHIDNIHHHRPALYLGPGSGQSREPASTRFPMMPTPAELRKVERATHALWRSIDALLLFFDECAIKARRNMESLHPFQPLGWIATIKMAGAMLDLVTLRILSERTQLARTYVQAAHTMSGMVPIEMQTLAHQHVLQLAALQAAAHKRCLSSCRRIALMTEFLLNKKVFQTSGILLRNVVNVATFLAHSPAVASPATLTSSSVGEDTSELVNPSLTSTLADISPPPGGQAIDPRTLLNGSSAHVDAESSTTATSAPTSAATSSEEGLVPESVFTGELPPFDALRKYHEVHICMEAMAQTGYALPSVEEDLNNIERVMHFSAMAAAPLSSSSSSSSSSSV